MSPTPLTIRSLGRIPYRKAWDLQKQLQRALIEGSDDDTLLLCEHEPVITIGRSTKSGNILLPKEEIAKRGIEVIEIERGGDVTYHGPGQLVGYPILNLNRKRRDVGWYMRSLEEVIITSLQAFGIDSERVPCRTGVWTEWPESGSFFQYRKISSIGVRISRWCTLHGFSLNVNDCHAGFSCINPCGFSDIRMTSMEEELKVPSKDLSKDLNVDLVGKVVLESFCRIFDFSPRREDATTVAQSET